MQKRFPKDFLWGSSTSSHQVEGGTYNQWTVWELEHAGQRAKKAPKRLSWIPTWPAIRDRALDPGNYVSGAGIDHYNRFKEDFRFIEKMNMNAFRFSVEWSRIEPEAGKWDRHELEYYRDYIAELNARGIKPFLNIFHWTLPVWFSDLGGFEKRSNLIFFERFVQKLTEELLDGVDYVITVNEINNYATFSYLAGEWPPQGRNPLKALMVYRNLTTAHKRAYKILKAAKPELQVGVAHQATANVPLRPGNPIDKSVAWLANYVWHVWFFNRIRKHQDFVGFNNYHKNYFKGVKIANPATPLNDMGWYMEPSALHDIIMDLHRRYKKPIIVTEHGLADMFDKNRQWWLEETIAAMEKALAAGADLRGYFHWSLFDNFEWAEGYWPRFGLIEVDRESGLKRRVRPSAVWYAKKIEELRK